jgi:hypothetical protein
MFMQQVLRLLGIGFILSLGACSGILGLTGSSAVKTSLGGCSPYPCVVVDIAELPKLPTTMPEASRAAVSSQLKRTLYAPLDVETNEPTSENLMEELQSRLQEYESVSDAAIDWTLTRDASVLYSDEKVTSCEVTNVGYLGGAHGFNERSLMTFDTKTGTRLGVLDLIPEQSQQMLNKVVEAEFRRTRSIRPGQSLQDAGFFILPGQELPLGENFALTDRGLEIQYNPYEVAPYALGPTSVAVPREAIEPLIKAELQGVFTKDQRARLSQ